jgi:hypothetical protein
LSKEAREHDDAANLEQTELNLAFEQGRQWALFEVSRLFPH